jgi:outer membrane lipoprotein-sorting protein
MNKSVKRWLPAAVVPVVVAGAAIALPMTADASPNLPEKSAQQLLELVANSDVTAFSGTVQETADLGLPEIPSIGGATADAASGALEFLTGTHEFRVFVGSDTQQRLQVMDDLAERDVVHNGNDVWLYDFTKNEAVHATLPDSAWDLPLPVGGPTTPQQLADQLLAAAGPSTQVTVENTATVAGRAAYVLRLTPKTDETLVGSVSVSVDAETGLPLGVVVTARGQQDPAFSLQYSAIDFSAPDSKLFDFAPPAGATVTEQALPTDLPSHDAKSTEDGTHPEPTVSGEGWATIAELPIGNLADPAASSGTGDATDLLDQLTTPVDGGRVLQTSLLSVMLTDDGRVLVGAVPADALQAAAAE